MRLMEEMFSIYGYRHLLPLTLAGTLGNVGKNLRLQ